jgi:hypothetical protein
MCPQVHQHLSTDEGAPAAKIKPIVFLAQTNISTHTKSGVPVSLLQLVCGCREAILSKGMESIQD